MEWLLIFVHLPFSGNVLPVLARNSGSIPPHHCGDIQRGEEEGLHCVQTPSARRHEGENIATFDLLSRCELHMYV